MIAVVMALTVVHGLIVIGSTLSLPVVLMFPATKPYYLAGIGIVLFTWFIFSDCPLTMIDERIRARLSWQKLDGDFVMYHLARLTGLRISHRAKVRVERVYLALVLAVILLVR